MSTPNVFLAAVYGILMIGFVALASNLPGVLQGTYAMFGMIQGPVLGVFTLGIMYPWANWIVSMMILMLNCTINSVAYGILKYYTTYKLHFVTFYFSFISNYVTICYNRIVLPSIYLY